MTKKRFSLQDAKTQKGFSPYLVEFINDITNEKERIGLEDETI